MNSRIAVHAHRLAVMNRRVRRISILEALSFPLEQRGPVVDLDDLLVRSDFVTIHVPATDQTEGLVDVAFLEKMKPSAWLINTSRGSVVDEPALLAALDEGRIRGAGGVEPPDAVEGVGSTACRGCGEYVGACHGAEVGSDGGAVTDRQRGSASEQVPGEDVHGARRRIASSPSRSTSSNGCARPTAHAPRRSRAAW